MLVVIIEYVGRTVLSDSVRRTVLSDHPTYTLTITNEPFHETQLFPFTTRDDLFAFLSDDLAVIINDQLQPLPTHPPRSLK